MPEFVTVAELQEMTAKSQDYLLTDPLELAEEWLVWFERRGERYLTTAAKLGYSSVSLDLPLALARKMHPLASKLIARSLRAILPGAKLALVEEECENEILHRLEISWATQKDVLEAPPDGISISVNSPILTQQHQPLQQSSLHPTIPSE